MAGEKIKMTFDNVDVMSQIDKTSDKKFYIGFNFIADFTKESGVVNNDILKTAIAPVSSEFFRIENILAHRKFIVYGKYTDNSNIAFAIDTVFPGIKENVFVGFSESDISSITDFSNYLSLNVICIPININSVMGNYINNKDGRFAFTRTNIKINAGIRLINDYVNGYWDILSAHINSMGITSSIFTISGIKTYYSINVYGKME